MSDDVKEIRGLGLARGMSRRRFLQRMALVGMGIPAAGGLLAACGGDDDDGGATVTAGTGQATATIGQAEATPTEAMAEPTATAGEAAEPTTTGGDAEPSATSGSGTVDQARLMGYEYEQAGNIGGTFVFTSDTALIGGHLNPLVTNYLYGIERLVLEPLVDVNPSTGEAVGYLAEAWELSDDLTTVTFTLRQGVTWHDGEPFDAEDVKFTLDAHMSGETNSDWYSTLAAYIESVDVVDRQTVSLTYQGPNVTFLVSNLPLVTILAAHVFEGTEFADIPAHPAASGGDLSLVVGTGPFRLQEFVVEDHATVVRYDNYWGGAPYLDEIIDTSSGSSQQVVAQRMLAGEIDYTPEIPVSQRAEFESDDRFQSYSYFALGTRFISFNYDPEVTTMFQEVELRQALLHAIDRDAIIEALFGWGEVAQALYPTDAWAFDPATITVQYPYDPARAAELLDGLGWALGSDGVRERDGQKLSFTIMAPDDEEFTDFTVIAQEYWREIGVAAEVNIVSWDVFLSDFSFEAFGYRYWWDISLDFSLAFACDQYPEGQNWMAYCNPELDELLNQAKNESDQERRLQLIQEINTAVFTNLPILPLYIPKWNLMASNRVHNAFTRSQSADWANPQLLWIDPQ
jgi:peptide/nickel transport system substrate-binding protein